MLPGKNRSSDSFLFTKNDFIMKNSFSNSGQFRAIPIVTCLFFLFGSLFAQTTVPCSTTTTPEEIEAYQELLDGLPENSGNPTTWEIPVRVTVCYKDDGNEWSWPVNDDYVDNWMLAKMNTKMNIGPNTYHFFRCGPINYVDITQFHKGTQDILSYSWTPGFLNFYFTGVTNASGANAPSHSSPLNSDHYYVVLNGGPGNIFNGTALHELGHTVGMLHTFEPAVVYTLPVTMAQSDYPEDNPLGYGRELNITSHILDQNDPRPFHKWNGGSDGDHVSDTPPGCQQNFPTSDVSAFYPSFASIAGCLDNNPNTPCVSGCILT